MAEQPKWEKIEMREDGSTSRLKLGRGLGWLYRVIEHFDDAESVVTVVYVPEP